MRQALGFCMKKDGEVCHVVKGGKNCVAAASNDSAPTLMTLGAMLDLVGPSGPRSVPIDEFWVADGIYNKQLAKDELLVSIRVPKPPTGHRGAYGKLRERGSITREVLEQAMAAADVRPVQVMPSALVMTPLLVPAMLYPTATNLSWPASPPQVTENHILSAADA